MEISVCVSVLFAMFIPFFFAMTPSKADQEKARVRRMASHRMNARLLRMDI
jgi:hypothetical protein